MEINMKKTGDNIYQLIYARNETLTSISKKLGISYQAIYQWIVGKSVPKSDTLYKLSRLLNVTMEDLIVMEED